MTNIPPGYKLVPIEPLRRFEEALSKLRWASERVAAGQQFNAYDRVFSDGKDEGKYCETIIALGPISKFRPIGECLGHDSAAIIEAALKFSTAAMLAAAPEPPVVESDVSFQYRVAPWMQECFGPKISADCVERGDRLLEEVFELLQSGGYDRDRVAPLSRYVWGRRAGEPVQEVGGVMVTLAAYCLAHDLDMHAAGEIELARILHPEIVEKIRAKQAVKAKTIPFSPLPQVVESDALERAKEEDGEANYRAWCENDPDHKPSGTIEDLALCATMLETYGPDCFPANERGQVNFARAMMDSVAAEIRAYLAVLSSQPIEGEG